MTWYPPSSNINVWSSASFRSASKILNANEQNTKHTRTMLGLKEIGVEGGNRLQMRTADREARGTVIGGLGEIANGESIDIDSEGDSRSTDGEEEGTYDEEGYDDAGALVTRGDSDDVDDYMFGAERYDGEGDMCFAVSL